MKNHVNVSGDGLILIDLGYQDSLYMAIQNIWEIIIPKKNLVWQKYG